jgi:hypothetical protein
MDVGVRTVLVQLLDRPSLQLRHCRVFVQGELRGQKLESGKCATANQTLKS